MRELFKHRNFRIYFLGSSVDTLGDMAFWLAAAIWVKELTGSTAQAGVTILALTLGTLLSPATGILVDRLPRKRTLMATNALTALVVLSLAAVHSAGQVWLIYLVMFCYGVSGAITTAAFSGLKEQLVPKNLFAEASGLAQAVQQATRLLTPALGLGLLSAYGGPALAVMDASTFVAGLGCWALVRVEDRRPPRPETPTGWWEESSAGFRYLFRSTLLRQLTFAMTVAVFAIGFLETLAIAVVTVGLHHAPTYVGVPVTVMGVTGTIGGLICGKAMKWTGPGVLAAIGMLCAAAGCLAMAVPVTAVVLVATGVLGFGLPVAVVGSITAMQLYTPNELMGRVSGADNLVVTGAQTAGIGVAAALISTVFYRDLCYFVGATILVSGVYLITRPEQQKSNLPQPPAAEAVATAEAAA